MLRSIARTVLGKGVQVKAMKDGGVKKGLYPTPAKILCFCVKMECLVYKKVRKMKVCNKLFSDAVKSSPDILF